MRARVTSTVRSWAKRTDLGGAGRGRGAAVAQVPLSFNSLLHTSRVDLVARGWLLSLSTEDDEQMRGGCWRRRQTKRFQARVLGPPPFTGSSLPARTEAFDKVNSLAHLA